MEKKRYEVISRKYRPQTFQEVIGQEPIVITLKNTLRLKRIAQAYLFCGTHGTGKTTLARLFAKALNCHALTEQCEPCNSCPSCLEILSGASLDVLEIDGASNRSIEDIRQISETVGYAPARGRFKIYLIDEVHMLTKEAFNALLKTLEEPPPTVRFFFATTEPHKVLPTILSRCIRFDLKRVPSLLIQKKLRSIADALQISIEEEALALIAEISEGAVRNAESLLDQIACYSEESITAEVVTTLLGLVSRQVFFEIDRAFSQGITSAAFEIAERITASGKDPAHFLDRLMHHVKTLLLIKYKRAEEVLAPLSERERKEYLLSASFYSEEQCLYLLDFLSRTSQEMTSHSFKRITLEMTLLTYLRSAKRVSIESLVQRLIALENSIKTHPIEPKIVDSTPPVNLSAEEHIPEPLEIQALPPEKIIEDTPESNKPPEPEPLKPTVQIKEETISAVATPPQAPKESVKKTRYDTILRFAAVELEGSLKNK